MGARQQSLPRFDRHQGRVNGEFEMLDFAINLFDALDDRFCFSHE
jgi:hypothetical protein